MGGTWSMAELDPLGSVLVDADVGALGIAMDQKEPRLPCHLGIPGHGLVGAGVDWFLGDQQVP